MSYIEQLRQVIGHRKIIAPGVRAVIRDAAGRVLLQRRGDFGTWGLPAGGLERDETVAAALAREVLEETNLRVLRAVPFGIYSNPDYSITYPNGDQTQPFTVAFLVEEWAGELAADGDESLELAFFALDALPPPERLHPPHRQALRDFQTFLDTGRLVVD